MKKIFFFLAITGVMSACKKNAAPVTPTIPLAKCIIKLEATTLAGNEKTWQYEFDATGKPTVIKVLRPNGSEEGSHQIGTNSTRYDFGTVGNYRILKYEVSDMFRELPAKAFVSPNINGILSVNYYTYFFFYNASKQLIKVGQQTDFVIGDAEYDLNISYNAQGNVSALQYVWTTGPNQVIAPITVTAYDDKPTPYAGVKSWEYLLVNFNWDNFDPEPIITALSNNNPLNYSKGSGTDLFTREMVYTYNNDGFPTERKNTNRNANGIYTFVQTFTYNCN